MMQDEIKRKLDELEKRIIILEGGEIKPAPVKVKLKPVEALAPKLGVTTDPFNPKSEGTPKPVDELPEGVEQIIKDKSKREAEELDDAFKDEQITKVQASLDKKPLDIDPLDRYLKDEKLKEKYGDRVEEAKKLIAELDNDEE